MANENSTASTGKTSASTVPTTPGLDLGPAGCRYFPSLLDSNAQSALVDQLRQILKEAPLFQPVMPKSGKPLSVRMSNCGALGWVADKEGYRYQPVHPVTQVPWPPIPQTLLDIWQTLAPGYPEPEACLINWYSPEAKMGMHQDRDEATFEAPVVSLSLGDDAMFRIGGTTRGGKTKGVRLKSGDGFVLGGEGRLAFHGITRIYPGTSNLLDAPGRINLTLRRVNGA